MLKVNTGDCWPSNGNDCNGLLYSWVEIPFTESNGLELISLNQLLYIHTLVVLWSLGVKVSAVLNCLRHLQLITWHTMIEEGAFSWYFQLTEWKWMLLAVLHPWFPWYKTDQYTWRILLVKSERSWYSDIHNTYIIVCLLKNQSVCID